MIVGVIGIGVVGGAIKKSFELHAPSVDLRCYDKTGEYSGEENRLRILDAEVIFVCVPTPTQHGGQNLEALCNVIEMLNTAKYQGVICIKCTVLPGMCEYIASTYPLRIVHNPEFLTAAKPYEDFMNQKSIIMSGKLQDTNEVQRIYDHLFGSHALYDFYQTYADYKVTELAKYYSNCFLAVKVTFANEMYDLCNMIGANYDDVRTAAISQGLIGANHTKVPGTDGKTGYGLGCLPKETQALSTFCSMIGLQQEVLNAAMLGNTKRRSFDSHCREINEKEIVI